eukprot:m.270583 g.270583  ORF g.270583 m.270583 type:complete len:80 (-) comp16083_c0_seq2:1107-1346(-)
MILFLWVTCVYLSTGTLPWYGAADNDLYSIMESISIQELCSGAPEVFEYYLTICLSLEFGEKPPYCDLRKALQICSGLT